MVVGLCDIMENAFVLLFFSLTLADFLEAVAVAKQAAPTGKLPVTENTATKNSKHINPSILCSTCWFPRWHFTSHHAVLTLRIGLTKID